MILNYLIMDGSTSSRDFFSSISVIDERMRCMRNQHTPTHGWIPQTQLGLVSQIQSV